MSNVRYLISVLLILWALEDRIVRLYPPVKVTGKSFKNVKRQTVPNQSLSLREIVRRFVRRESLPISKEGIYEERFGDLEKLKLADITEQLERAEEIKQQIANFNKRELEKSERLKAEAAAALLPKAPVSPAEGGQPIKSPPPQGA